MLESITQLIGGPKRPKAIERLQRKFLKFFPKGFQDPKYFAWERGYKIEAHQQWDQALNQQSFRKMLKARQYLEVGQIAARIESKTNLLFSFEKMAFRDAVRDPAGAQLFSEGLYNLLYGRGGEAYRFEAWCETVGKLPRTKTRVLTHPVVTVFPFIAMPDRHIFLKPNATRRAAALYGFPFDYNSRPSWEVYSSLLKFSDQIRTDIKQMRPKDMIDIQSFIWVLGSHEYA